MGPDGHSMTGTTCAIPAISPTRNGRCLRPCSAARDDRAAPRVADARADQRHVLMLRDGIPWRMLTTHIRPHQTVCRWFSRFRDNGTWESLNHHPVMLDRVRAGREASPIAGVVAPPASRPPRPVASVEDVLGPAVGAFQGTPARRSRGERHALVDTDGRGLEWQAHPASAEDRDGAPSGLNASRARFPFIERVFAGSVHAGERVAQATAIAVQIVRGLPDQVGVQVRRAAGSTLTAGSQIISKDRSRQQQTLP
jgi:transposase